MQVRVHLVHNQHHAIQRVPSREGCIPFVSKPRPYRNIRQSDDPLHTRRSMQQRNNAIIHLDRRNLPFVTWDPDRFVWLKRPPLRRRQYLQTSDERLKCLLVARSTGLPGDPIRQQAVADRDLVTVKPVSPLAVPQFLSVQYDLIVLSPTKSVVGHSGHGVPNNVRTVIPSVYRNSSRPRDSLMGEPCMPVPIVMYAEVVGSFKRVQGKRHTGCRTGRVAPRRIRHLDPTARNRPPDAL